jgi:uncharacterized caspase-like protein
MATSNKNSSLRRKLALIIGNDNYTQPYNKLKQSINNARDLSDLLTTIDFNVSLYTDVDASMMDRIENFSNTINDGDLVLFYFTGHGYQVCGKNFFIPVDDANIAIDTDIRLLGINVEGALKRLVNKNSSYVTIFILDCCRPYSLESPSTLNCE